MLFEKRKRLIKGTTEVMVSSDFYQTLFLLSVLYINMKDTGNKSVKSRGLLEMRRKEGNTCHHSAAVFNPPVILTRPAAAAATSATAASPTAATAAGVR